jgi:hypothetical protein
MCLCGSRSSADPARSIASRRARTACNVRGARTGGPAYRATLWPAGRLLVRVPKQPIKPGAPGRDGTPRDTGTVRCPTDACKSRRASQAGRQGRASAWDHTELFRARFGSRADQYGTVRAVFSVS